MGGFFLEHQPGARLVKTCRLATRLMAPPPRVPRAFPSRATRRSSAFAGGKRVARLTLRNLSTNRTGVLEFMADARTLVQPSMQTIGERDRAKLRQLWREFDERIAALVQPSSVESVVVDRVSLDAAIDLLTRGGSGETVAGWMRRWHWDSVARRLHGLAERGRTIAERLGKPGVEIVAEDAGLRFPPSDAWSEFWGQSCTSSATRWTTESSRSRSARAGASRAPAGWC